MDTIVLRACVSSCECSQHQTERSLFDLSHFLSPLIYSSLARLSLPPPPGFFCLPHSIAPLSWCFPPRVFHTRRRHLQALWWQCGSSVCAGVQAGGWEEPADASNSGGVLARPAAGFPDWQLRIPTVSGNRRKCFFNSPPFLSPPPSEDCRSDRSSAAVQDLGPSDRRQLWNFPPIFNPPDGRFKRR